MKTWIRRSLWALGALAAAAVATVATGHALAERKMNRRIELPALALELPGDAAALERGHYLFASRGCTDCHGNDGAGRTFVDDGRGLKLAGPNISPGPGNVVVRYGAADWERTLRHGVKPDGRPLLFMPSEDYNRLSNDDIAAIAAYVRTLPPVAGRAAVIELPLPLRLLYGFGLVEDAAAKIDHRLPPAAPVAAGVTFAHGQYVAQMCRGCHGAALQGGKVPGGPPDWPAAPDLRPGAGSALGRYPDAQALLRMFHSGRRPDGSEVKVMPFGSLRELNEVDIRALHLYLSTRSASAQPGGLSADAAPAGANPTRR